MLLADHDGWILTALHPGADPVRMSGLCACAVAIEAGLEAAAALNPLPRPSRP